MFRVAAKRLLPSVVVEGSFFCDKLSQKLRHIRWLRKRRSVQGEGSGIKHNKVTKYVALPNLDDSMPYSDACSELKHMYESNSADVPKILRLLRLTFEDRRKFINGLKNADINQILKEFPHLQDIRFIDNEFSLMKPDIQSQDVQSRWSGMTARLRLLLEISSESKTDLDIMLGLQQLLDSKRSAKKMKSCITLVENQSFQPVSMKKEPPRLVVTAGDVDDVASYSSFVLSDGIVLQVGSSTIQDMVLGLLHCYYAWGLTYPKDFQVLPFVQEHVLNDCEQMFKSAAYIKFNMKFRDTK